VPRDSVPARGGSRRRDGSCGTPLCSALGLASLLSDGGHEMVSAAHPGFPRTLGPSSDPLGVIEGVADASLSASKYVGATWRTVRETPRQTGHPRVLEVGKQVVIAGRGGRRPLPYLHDLASGPTRV
jgi:hypothetical protein